MLSTLYLLRYNNYYNRILKKHDTLQDYGQFLIGSPLTNINFNPNDGINAKQVINWNNDIPDYLLVVEGTTIISRWYVIATKRLLTGQFELSLFRDCLADYKDEIMNAPMFIDRGYCSVDDSAIFNDEQVSTNSIKEREISLKDPTECSWVVGYCALRDEEETQPTKIEYGSASDVYDYWTPSLEDWDFYDFVGQNKAVKFPLDLTMTLKTEGDTTGLSEDTAWNFIYKMTKNGKKSYTTEKYGRFGFIPAVGWSTESTQQRVYDNITNIACSNLYNKVISYHKLTDSPELYNSLTTLSGRTNKTKILKVGTGDNATYYSININRTEGIATDQKPVYQDSLYLAWTEFLTSINTSAGKQVVRTAPDRYQLDSITTSYHYTTIYIDLVETTPYSGLEFYFPWGRKSLADAPYCMFAIPYGEIDVLYTEGGTTKSFTTNKDNALSIAAGIAKGLSKKLYDIQLLPYCPVSLLRNSKFPTICDLRNAPFNNWTINEHYVLIESVKQIMFFCEQSSDSFNINVPNSLYTFSDAAIFKTMMLTQNVRLCSPNYNGLFEFNVYKNRGLQSINVDYTYKPFQPYIHLNPNFGGLYGKDFDDARGLICGGDFSLPITSSDWINYQLTNKTYQEQFNRQIENMEVKHEYSKLSDTANALFGTFAGAAQGASAGMIYSGGNPVAGAAGGVVGGLMSAGGGLADMYINEQLRKEQKSYATDRFQLQLENIKALPDSLTRVSAFNANNKVFPFLEIYNSTDEEFNAIFNKLVYNGFNIGRPDTLSNMISNKPTSISLGFISGRLIRLEGISDDFRIVSVIADELNKGVYV